MIDRPELAELLSVAAAADVRFPALTSPQDPRITGWQQILGDVRLEDAQEAMMRIVRRPQLQVLQPGHILEEVRVLRRERLKAVPEAALVPPDDLAAGQYPGWLRAARRHVADGRSVEYALEAADVEFGASRRLLGPATGRTVRQLIEEAS